MNTVTDATSATTDLASMEEMWASIDSAGPGPRVDLAAVDRLGSAASLYLLSRIVQASRTGRRIELDLPDDDRSLSALAGSGLPDLIGDTSGRPFPALLSDADAARWRDRVENGGSVGALLPATLLRGRVELRALRAFGPGLAAEWSDEWLSPYALSYLDRLLSSGRGRYLATHVVHEAGMNAVRHPGSRVIARAATTDVGTDRAASLEMSFWDDGEGIASTLGRAPDEVPRTVLAARQSPLFKRELDLTYDKADGSPASRRVQSNQEQVVTRDSEEAMLVLAATFPGITCDPSGPGMSHPETLEATPQLGVPGMGLFVLTTTVTEILKGAVTLRTGTTSLVVRSSGSKDDPRLAADLRVVDAGSPFLGNLVTVRVPLPAAG